MPFKKASLILIMIFGLGSCTGQKKALSRGDGFSFFKNPDSNQACVNTNLSQWELTGTFLHRILNCASNRSSDGGETLPATQNLLSALSAEKMQKLIDFALMPDETASNHEERYPYLLAMSSILDRGLTDGQSQGLNLATERLDQLQPFLLSLDPSRLQKQLALWSQSGKLDELLAELGLFVQSLENDSLSAVTRELLEGQNFGPRFLKVSEGVLKQDPLMDSLDAALSGQTWHAPDAASQARMLHAWRQPQSPDAPERQLALNAGSSPPTTFAKHFDQFNQTLSDDEIQKLSRFLISVWDSYRRLASDERAFLTRRLASGLEETLDQQKNVAQWLMAVAQDLSSMPASDLNGISETLGRLLEPSNDPSLDTLRSKLWSSRIMEQMLQLLSDGGTVPGCSALTIPGMKDLSSTDFAPTYALLRTLNTPQAACDGQIPLKAVMEAWSNVAVGRPCSSANCLELTEKPNDSDLTASYWADDFVEPEPKIVQELVLTALQESKSLLERDRYFLRNIGVANRAVDPRTIDYLIELWQKASAQSLRDVALWEQSLAQDANLKNLLATDPIEKLLSLKLERLSSLSQQFHDLVPVGVQDIDKTTNQRAARVFAGVYNQGPMEQALRYKLPATLEGADDILQDASFNWPADIKQTFANDRSLLSHFLQRFKHADSIFRNPELGSLVDGSEVPVASLGSPARYAGFDEPGQVSIQPRLDNRVIQPMQAMRAAADDPAAWGLWYQQLSSSGLVSKDMPPEQTASFQDFSNQLIENMSSDARWSELLAATEPQWSLAAPDLNTAFFDVVPYSAADARLLALYYLRHYHKLPLALPVNAQLPVLPTGGLRGFFSGAAMVSNMDADFALFVKLFPDQFRSNTTTLEAFSAQALNPGSEGMPLFAPTKISPVTRVGLLNGKYPQLLSDPNFKLFSTLNLLGLTKSGSAYYIQPLVGLDATSCAAADGQATSCAVELNGADDAARQTAYQTFVRAVVAQNFCPLLATDQFGPRDVWAQRLALQLAEAKTCSNLPLQEAKVSDTIRFPAWLSRRVMNDVFNMGRQARLKKGLVQIPAALRFYKLSQENLQADERSELWLRQARGHWSALNAASQSRRQAYAFQFWAAQPNLLNAAIDQWEQTIETTSWTDFLARLAQRNGDGTSLDVVHEFLALVISTQKESAQAGESLLGMGFTLMERISARPDLLDAAGHILGNFASAENYDFVGRDLPYAMTLFTHFDWNDPGLRFSKFLTQKETIRAWVLLCEYFSPDEFGRLLNQLQKSSTELGEKSARAGLLQRLLKENVALGTLLEGDQQKSLASRWNAVFLAWRTADFGKGFLQEWEELLAVLDQQLQTLDGRATHSAAKIMELWLPHILRQGVSLLHRHQEAGATQDTSLWSKVALNLVQSIETEPLGARALSRFLADPRLGFVQSSLWIRALNDAKYRQPLAQALISLSSVSEQLWRDALVESSELLGRLSKAFGYMKQRMVWKEDPEHNAYRLVINQLYMLSSDVVLRDHQIEILQFWFRDEEEAARLVHSPIPIEKK